MNLVRITRLLASAAVLFSCSKPSPSVRWVEGAPGEDGKCIHKIVVENAKSLPANWTIWCSQMPVGAKTVEGSDAIIEEYQGNLHRITPCGVIADSLVICYESSPLKRHSWAPEGFVLQDMDSESITGMALKADYSFLPLASDGQKWYDYNASLDVAPVGIADIIPAPKRVSATPFIHTDQLKRKPHGWYQISIDANGQPSVKSEDEDGEFYALATLSQLRQNNGAGQIPQMYIEDWPDFQYRGYMLDVSRNFTSVENLKKFIDVLARYKVNYLHMHLGDDEGWRLAVDGIPELTSVGAFHCLDPLKGLQPSYDGCADPASESLSNGFYSREEYVEILRYAWERRIRVISEFDTPGHSRAAIYSMKAYENRTGDSSMRLQDPDDDSRYYGAQGYKDNVMSVELESVYTFIGRLFDYLIDVYAEAGVPLDAIHVGGDEVPHGAWHGKPLHSMFLGRVADIAAEKGVKIAGWQEVATCADPVVAAKLKKVMFVNHVWNTAWGSSELPFSIAAKGYPTVMSNVEFTYADQAYSSNKQEIAHSWARYIDDTMSLGLPVRRMDNLLGVQVQLFTETVRSFDDLCYDNFPKVLGVFERGWNLNTSHTPSSFYSAIVYNQMPWWESNGIAYHIPQPGMVVADGVVVTNSAIPGAKVEVSADGKHAVAVYGSRRSCETTL